jgi:alpha-tubulin suppressor-like RCC1 family protein
MRVCIVYALCVFFIAGVHGQSEFAGYAPPPEHESERPVGPLILSEVGDVYSFGDGSTGQLGLGPASLMTTPRIIDQLPRGKIYMLSAGYAHSVAVTETGSIYTWGNNAFGQLGFRNISVDFTYPSKVHSLDDTRIVYVCAGFAHTVALTDQGVVYAWGANDKGQLGLEGFTATYTPSVVTGLMGKKVTRVSCGYDTTAAVTEKGLVYTFGDNSLGQLGLGHTRPMVGVNQVTALADSVIVQAEVGWTHMIALDENGVAYGWGDNSIGQLGLGYKDSPVLDVTPIERLRDKGVYFVATGYFHNFVLTDSGMVYGFGSNDHGQLGVYDKFDRDIPVAVPLLSMRNVTHISAGGTHSIVATGNNRVYSFGANAEGQLGTANFEDKVRPIAVEMENKRIYEVLAGYQYSLVLAESCTDLPENMPDGERDVQPTEPVMLRGR